MQLTEALVSGRMQRDQDDGKPRLLVESGLGSATRLVNGAVVTEAYETARRAAVSITKPPKRINELEPLQQAS